MAISPEFRDIDLMGVVHNCVYFEWFERGRLSIMNEALNFDRCKKTKYSSSRQSKIHANIKCL